MTELVECTDEADPGPYRRVPNRVESRRIANGYGERQADRSRIRRLTRKQRMARQ